MTLVNFHESLTAGLPPPELFQAMGEFAADVARSGALVDKGRSPDRRGMGRRSCCVIEIARNGSRCISCAAWRP
jgi:hypothetical protein